MGFGFCSGGAEEDEGDEYQSAAGGEEGFSDFGFQYPRQRRGDGVGGFRFGLGLEDFVGFGPQDGVVGFGENGIGGGGFLAEGRYAEPVQDIGFGFDELDPGGILFGQLGDFVILNLDLREHCAIFIIVLQFRSGQDGYDNGGGAGQEEDQKEQKTDCQRELGQIKDQKSKCKT